MLWNIYFSVIIGAFVFVVAYAIMSHKKTKTYNQTDQPKMTLEEEQKKPSQINPFILIFAIIGIVAFVFSFFYNRGIYVSNSLIPENISLSEFNSLRNDMTYREVCNIIGSQGTLMSQYGEGEYEMRSYSWKGNGSAGANAVLSFQAGKLNGRTQIGLK